MTDSSPAAKRAPRALRPAPPTPPTPPSGKAARALRLIDEIIAAPETADDYIQRQVDLTHIAARVTGAYDPCMYEAVRNPGLATYRGMADKVGISRSAVQQRVDNGDPTRPSRYDRTTED
ncbi:hypothetical protein [Pseudonocardia sp. NPDC049635]|uniref:hypothetical protein n=1 Tax=Pseudonocardia sp. NPDC049635 TaxID=3155506 RepID=UPI0033F04AAC